jgi:DNA-binding transcriptional regulator YiaG
VNLALSPSGHLLMIGPFPGPSGAISAHAICCCFVKAGPTPNARPAFRLFFLLRGVNHEELVDVSAAVTEAGRAGSSRRRIAAAISAWRSLLGETQSTFAARIGVTAASISQWEKKGPLAIGMRPGTLSALRKAWQQTRA